MKEENYAGAIMTLSITTLMMVVSMIVGIWFVNNGEIDTKEVKPAVSEDPGLQVLSAETQRFLTYDEIVSLVIESEESWNVPVVDLNTELEVGTATLVRGMERTYVYVQVDLPDPEAGKYYEGLFAKSGENYVLTGRFVKDSDGKYSMAYASNRPLDDFWYIYVLYGASSSSIEERRHILEAVWR